MRAERCLPLGSHFRLARIEYPNPAIRKVCEPDPALRVLPEKPDHLYFGWKWKYRKLFSRRTYARCAGTKIIRRPDVARLLVNHDSIDAVVRGRWLIERHLFGLVINP